MITPHATRQRSGVTLKRWCPIVRPTFLGAQQTGLDGEVQLSLTDASRSRVMTDQDAFRNRNGYQESSARSTSWNFGWASRKVGPPKLICSLSAFPRRYSALGGSVRTSSRKQYRYCFSNDGGSNR